MALYLMLSHTNTGMGKLIRCFTHNRYNHVSLTLDPELQRFCSFARYAQDVPLAGGFVAESVERLLCDGGPVPVRLFRVELDRAQEERVARLFARADDRSSGLIYDSLGALLSVWHIRSRIPGAYTCLGLASAVLQERFRDLRELEQYLEPYEIFQGDLRELAQDMGDRSGAFFCHRGFLRGTKDTTVHFSRLAARLLRLRRCVDPVAALYEGVS